MSSFSDISNNPSSWYVVTDQVMGGKSELEADFNDGIFSLSGFVTTVNNGGFVRLAHRPKNISKDIKGVGEQTEKEAREKGVITICSCSPNEYSWELKDLQQGVFTYALLEGLGSKGKKATVERLNEHLKYRVKELAKSQGKQTPSIMADPIEKSHLILMPKYATKSDISMLKNYCYQAQVDENFN